MWGHLTDGWEMESNHGGEHTLVVLDEQCPLCVCVLVCVCARGLSCSVIADSLQPHGLWLARLLCPWNFPDKNTGVGFLYLLHEIFLTQGSNPCLLFLLY